MQFDTLQSATSVGTVKWYEPALGYGYIVPRDGTQDIFVHFTALDTCGLTALEKGQTVHFDKRVDGGITRASNIFVSEAA